MQSNLAVKKTQAQCIWSLLPSAATPNIFLKKIKIDVRNNLRVSWLILSL
jgi:hypothetical protein